RLRGVRDRGEGAGSLRYSGDDGRRREPAGDGVLSREWVLFDRVPGSGKGRLWTRRRAVDQHGPRDAAAVPERAPARAGGEHADSAGLAARRELRGLREEAAAGGPLG